jgi:hypothetical protein
MTAAAVSYPRPRDGTHRTAPGLPSRSVHSRYRRRLADLPSDQRQPAAALLAAPERAGVLAHHGAVPPDDDAFRIGVDLHRTPGRVRRDRVLVGVETDQAGLRHRRGRVEAVEASRERYDKDLGIVLEAGRGAKAEPRRSPSRSSGPSLGKAAALTTRAKSQSLSWNIMRGCRAFGA